MKLPRDLSGVRLIKALEQIGYCPRQCALIHVEQAFDENVFTMRGNAAHERVYAMQPW